MLTYPRNRVGSISHISFPCSPILSSATYRDKPSAGSGMGCRMGLAKTGEDATISGNSPAFNRANAQETLHASRFAS
jgi:hypothetical protein